MKSMKLLAGLVVALMLALGGASVHAKVDAAGTKAPTGASEDATRKCPPFC